MKRIAVDKKELIAELIERIIEDAEQDLVLVIPKGTGLGASVSNFHLLSREAKAANKKITIESVDESILALAKSSQIEAVHPLLGSPAASALSDIVPRSKVSKVAGVAEVRQLKEETVQKISPESLQKSSEDTLLLEASPHRFRLRFNLKTIL